MTKESQMFVSAVQHEIEMLRLLSGIERKAGHTQSTWQVIRDVAARLEVAALAAQSAAPVGACQKCGALTHSEEAYVNGEIWCHPCADALAKPGDS